MKKILKVIKTFFIWLFKNIKYVGIVAGALFIMMAVKRLTASWGKVKEKSYWEPVPGDKTKVFVWDKDSNRTVVKLPINPNTGKQIKSNEVKSVGISAKKEEGLNVEIKHIITNRRSTDFVSGDFTG